MTDYSLHLVVIFDCELCFAWLLKYECVHVCLCMCNKVTKILFYVYFNMLFWCFWQLRFWMSFISRCCCRVNGYIKGDCKGVESDDNNKYSYLLKPVMLINVYWWYVSAVSLIWTKSYVLAEKYYNSKLSVSF